MPMMPSSEVTTRRLNPPQTLSTRPPTTTPIPQTDSSQPSCRAPRPKYFVTRIGISEKAGLTTKLIAIAMTRIASRPGQPAT